MDHQIADVVPFQVGNDNNKRHKPDVPADAPHLHGHTVEMAARKQNAQPPR